MYYNHIGRSGDKTNQVIAEDCHGKRVLIGSGKRPFSALSSLVTIHRTGARAIPLPVTFNLNPLSRAPTAPSVPSPHRRHL